MQSKLFLLTFATVINLFLATLFNSYVYMVDLKTFRKVNGLTQMNVAAFLGVSAPFITKVERGDNKLPPDKLHKLLNNDCGWDTSMLAEDDTEADEPATSADIKALQREIELLREQLKAERERCDKYIAIIGRWCH